MIIIYFIILNILTFFVYGMDKYFARTNRFRISEKILFMLSIMGGAVGALLGMKLFRHKTKKFKFKLLNFVMSVVWCYILCKDILV